MHLYQDGPKCHLMVSMQNGFTSVKMKSMFVTQEKMIQSQKPFEGWFIRLQTNWKHNLLMKTNTDYK